jgi:RNA polymerase sigma-32 factor
MRVKPGRKSKKRDSKTSPEFEVLPAEKTAPSPSEPVPKATGSDLDVIDVSPSDLEIEEVPGEPGLEASEESAGLVRYDPLRAYLREISRFRPLSREEEHELAVRYSKFGDVDAAYKLVSTNLWLVVKIAREYERAARSLLDLIQEGSIGVMEAVKNFDPYRGVRFPSYAAWWIKAYIIRYVIANWRMVKIGTTQAQRKLFFNLKKEQERLEREGFYGGPKLLAERLDVKESEIVEMSQRLSSPDVSVDAPLQTESDANLLSVLPSEALSAEDILAKKEMREQMLSSFDEFAATLNKNELRIFKQRMLNEDKNTLQDLSDELKVSRERIRQIENKVREKLKRFLQEKFGTEVGSLDF